VQNEKLNIHQPRFILTTAESLDGHTRKIINDLFTGELLDVYACTEAGILATECPKHNGLHVLAYKTIIEIVDDNNKILPPGQYGNVIVTDLHNTAFPLIRYSGMGDIAGYKHEKCQCKLTALPLLKSIEGRRIDSFILPGNKIIHPFKLTIIMQDVPGVNKFQIRQEKIDEIRILIVKSSSESANRLSMNDNHEYMNLQKKFLAVLGNDVTVKFDFVDEIPRQENSHKIPPVVSLVNK